MQHGFTLLGRADCVAVFGKYEKSKGSMREITYAENIVKEFICVYDEKGNVIS